MENPGQSNPLAASKSENRGEKRTSLEESKTTEAVLADRLSAAGVEDVDEHVFFRVSRKEARKDFDELFLVGGTGLFEAVADVESMGTLSAVQPHPETRAVGADFVEPLSVFQDTRFYFLETDVLGESETWK